jgi:SAM-dependent methyltransferase
MTQSREFIRLTDDRWWDDYWSGTSLPQEFDEKPGVYLEELLNTFHRHLPVDPTLSVLEIGGAPGRYLAYLRRHFGYEVNVLEYSTVGYELARRNLELLEIPARIVHGDMFDARVSIPRCDIVYSLGLIEHFDDPTAVIEAHLRFVKPGGILIIGAPNLLGVSRLLYDRLSPSVLQSHHAPATDPRAWQAFEERFRLVSLWKGYVGGFEPGNFHRLESRRPLARAAWWLLRGLTVVLNIRLLRGLRRLNHRAWSAYFIAFYRVPVDADAS